MHANGDKRLTFDNFWMYGQLLIFLRYALENFKRLKFQVIVQFYLGYFNKFWFLGIILVRKNETIVSVFFFLSISFYAFCVSRPILRQIE